MELTEREEAENAAMAEALSKIADIVNTSESDPEVMQRMLIQIYRITDRAIINRTEIY